MIPKADLVVGGVVAAIAGHQLSLARALEAGARRHVENAVGSVAILGRIAASLHLDVIDILGTELRADVAGDVGVGYGNAVNGPGNLVTATHVQLIVRHDRTWREVSDERQAVAAVSSGSLVNLGAADHCI